MLAPLPALPTPLPESRAFSANCAGTIGVLDAAWLMVRFGTSTRNRPNNGSPICATPPPTTMMSGSSRLTIEPIQAASNSAVSSSARFASASPAAARVAISCALIP